eukprot:scpid83963/ scgid23078/ Sushi, von Willebrand factor type A, EGF and pentraxin domain-containing protein 1; Polydom
MAFSTGIIALLAAICLALTIPTPAVSGTQTAVSPELQGYFYCAYGSVVIRATEDRYQHKYLKGVCKKHHVKPLRKIMVHETPCDGFRRRSLPSWTSTRHGVGVYYTTEGYGMYSTDLLHLACEIPCKRDRQDPDHIHDISVHGMVTCQVGYEYRFYQPVCSGNSGSQYVYSCTKCCAEWFGNNCSRPCLCKTGTCHHVTGECTCDADHYGRHCEKDIFGKLELKDETFCPSGGVVLRIAHEKLDYEGAALVCAKNNGTLLTKKTFKKGCARNFIDREELPAWISGEPSLLEQADTSGRTSPINRTISVICEFSPFHMNVKCAENFHIRMGVAGTYNAYDFCTHFKMDILNKPQQKKLQHCYLPALRNAKYQHYQYVGTLRAGRKTRRRMFLHSIASGEKIVAPMWNKAARICARKNNTGAFKDQSIFCPSTVTVLRRAYEKLDYNRAVALCARNNGKLLGTRAHTDRCAKRFIKKGKKQTAAWIYSSKWADAKRVYDLSTYPRDENTHLITICEYPIKCTVHKIQNGEREEATLSYNQTARYTCWTGYEMDGIANPICNNSGRLASIPTCRPFKCIAPRLPKAAVFPADVLYLEAVHYECDTGWLLIGDPKPTCTASRNFSSVPTCSIVKCLVPSILNGWSEEKEVNYQKPVIYKCNPGYTLVYGSTPPHCNAYGNLNSTGNITCERDHGFNRSQPCSNTRTILQISKQKYNFFSADALCRKHNGWLLNRKTLTSSCASTLLQDDVEVWLSGTIKGISRARPTNQGHDWDFKLKHVVCEMLPCGPPPSITNGAWRNTTRLHQVQEVMYACDDGYSMQGKGHLVCQVDRQWSPNPPTCEVKCSAQLPADFLR